MKKPGNFSKAMEELIGGKISASETEEADRAQEPEIQESPQPAFHATTSEYAPKVRGEAVITADMVIKGSINSEANISISGSVVGDVSSEGDITIQGKVEGNIKAQSLMVQGGTITGDILASAHVVVADSAAVNGNIKADRIEINGKIVGNLEASSRIVLNQKASIEGNISAALLSVLEGAELKGNVSIKKA